MKVKLNGNIATLTSNIKFEDLAKVGKLSAEDAKTGETLFVCKADPCNQGINTFSAVFGYANAEGKACMNIALPTCPDTPIEVQKECIADMLLTAIDNFEHFEEEFIRNIDESIAARNTLMNSIELA